MTDPHDYLIITEEGEFHDLKVSWSRDRSLLYISSNSRTMGMSPAMAEELLKALMATLKGGFIRALSETALQQELSSKLRRAAPPPNTSLKPELDLL